MQGWANYKLRPYNMDANAPHHALLCQELDDLLVGKTTNLLVMMPPGSAKSTYCSVEFPQYALGKFPQLQMIAASHTQLLAEGFGRRVRNGVADPVFSKLWPGVGVAPDSAAAGNWSTTRGGTYFAVGVGGSVTGRRADVAVIDDPVASREDAESERQREKTWQWFVNDLRTRMKPGGRTMLIMTRWHEDDLAGRLLDLERDKWRVVEIPMEAFENDPLGRAPGEQLWKEWFTPEMIEAAKLDPRSWWSLYQQRPRPIEGAEFRMEWLQRYTQQPRRRNTIILADPAGDPKAGGKRKRSDYTVFWVFGLGADRNYYLLDGVRDRLNLTQRVDTLFRLHHKWKPHHVRYERYGMQADVAAVQAEMNRRDYRFRIVEVGGALEKNARIRRLIPLFEQGRIWLPNELWYTPVATSDNEVRNVDIMKQFIAEEYSAFPVSRHDDMLDAMSRLEEPSIALPWPGDDSFDSFMPGMPYSEPTGWQAFDPIAGY
jgi:predicted phage terminase large subunit-like protein